MLVSSSFYTTTLTQDCLTAFLSFCVIVVHTFCYSCILLENLMILEENICDRKSFIII